MEYQHVIRDFAERTRQNLDYIERSVEGGEEVYDITQLVNSMLGLLVFPQQRYFNNIPKTPLKDLREDGWPDVQVIGDFQAPKDLRLFMRYLRNAIAHFNIEFIADEKRQLHGIRVWNIDTRNPKHPKNWEAELSFAEIRIIVEKFITLIVEEVGKDA